MAFSEVFEARVLFIYKKEFFLLQNLENSKNVIIETLNQCIVLHEHITNLSKLLESLCVTVTVIQKMSWQLVSGLKLIIS